jgi:hypothetical protein
MLVSLADPSASLRAGSFCVFDGVALAVVLRGDLESVDDDLGAARVDSVRSQGEHNVRDGELDGVGVFERRKVMNDRTQVSFANLGHPDFAVAVGLVEVAEILIAKRWRLALFAASKDVSALVVHWVGPPWVCFL